MEKDMKIKVCFRGSPRPMSDSSFHAYMEESRKGVMG
jgi:hypothetical protein